MGRLSLKATTRRARDAEVAAEYLAQVLRDEGAVIVSARGVAKKRGGAVGITADAEDAGAVMNAARLKLDGEANAYATDTLNELQMAAFKDASGGMLGFVNEDYRFVREFLA